MNSTIPRAGLLLLLFAGTLSTTPVIAVVFNERHDRNTHLKPGKAQGKLWKSKSATPSMPNTLP